MIPLVAHLSDLESGTEEHYAFLRSPVRIGRGELNDLPMRQQFVSTYHGLIQFDDAEARYVDLGSTNGSLVNGAPLEPDSPRVLAVGDVLSIGTYRLTFERRITGAQPAAARETLFALRAATLAGRQVGSLEGAPAPGTTPEGPETELEVAVQVPPEVDAGIAAASLELDLGFASYRGAWEHLEHQLQEVIATAPPGMQQLAARRLAERYPALLAETDFAALVGERPGRAGVPVPAAGREPAHRAAARDGGLAEDALELLRALGESYLAGRSRLASRQEIEVLLARIAGALETFARAFVELRRGYEEFGREMGVRAIQTEGPLARARDATQVLGLLLEPAGEGREAELQRLFADFMIHQVALLRGVVEGARGLLDQLSPEAVSAAAPGGHRLTRPSALWRAFEQRYHEIADEESSVSEVLFGREFARAYAALAGQGADRAEGSDREKPAGRPDAP